MNTVDAVSYLLEHNLHFRAKVSLDDATEVLRKFPCYNEIPTTIWHLPQVIAEAIGPTDLGGDNPNNGTFCNLEFSLGNEHSLVIYIRSDVFYRKGDSADRQKKLLWGIGRTFFADEVTVEIHPSMVGGAPTVKARFWWD